MSIADALNQGAIDWLNQTGEAGTYRSARTGVSVDVQATPEMDASVVNTSGMIVRGHTISIKTGVVENPSRGDVVDIPSGRFEIQEHLEDSGIIQRFLVTRL